MESNLTNASLYVYHWEKAGGLCQLKGSTGIALYITMLFILAIITTIENLIIIIVIYKNDCFRRPSFYLLGILAVIDFLTGCVVTPIKASITVDLDFQLAKVFLWMFMGVVLLSISTIMLISFDRFFHVYFLERYNLTKYKLAGVLFFCWIGPVVFIIMLASSSTGQGGGIFVLVYYFFCIAAIVTAHIAILKALRRHTSIHLSNDLIKQQEQAVKTTLIIVVTFVSMSFIPVLSIVLALAGIYNRGLCASTYFLMLANSAINPIIYCMRVPRMKDYVEKLLWAPANTTPNLAVKGHDNEVSMTEDVLDERRREAAGMTPELMNVAETVEENRGAAAPGGGEEFVVNVDVNENRRASLYAVPQTGNNETTIYDSVDQSTLSLEEIRMT